MTIAITPRAASTRMGLVLAAAVVGVVALATPAFAQYYGRGYYETPPPEPFYEQRRGYRGEYSGYEQPRGYGRQEYGRPQGGYYIDKETAKRNARALKEQQKRAIKGGYYQQQSQPRYNQQAQPGYYQQPRQALPPGVRPSPRANVPGTSVLYGPTVGAPQ